MRIISSTLYWFRRNIVNFNRFYFYIFPRTLSRPQLMFGRGALPKLSLTPPNMKVDFTVQTTNKQLNSKSSDLLVSCMLPALPCYWNVSESASIANMSIRNTARTFIGPGSPYTLCDRDGPLPT